MEMGIKASLNEVCRARVDFLPYLPWNLIQADFSRNQELGNIMGLSCLD